MNAKYENITIHQLNLMKHAIGLDNSRLGIENGTYTAYRNRFCTYEKDSDWEALIELGAASCRVVDHSIFYYVSDDGLQMMGEILGFKIVEGD